MKSACCCLQATEGHARLEDHEAAAAAAALILECFSATGAEAAFHCSALSPTWQHEDTVMAAAMNAAVVAYKCDTMMVVVPR